MIAQLPPEAYVILFSLNYFPGTAVFERARAEGVIRDVDRDLEDFDGWSEKHYIFDRETGRPSPAAILPLLAVQHLRQMPPWKRTLWLLFLCSPIGFWLLGTWRWSHPIRNMVERSSRTDNRRQRSDDNPGEPND